MKGCSIVKKSVLLLVLSSALAFLFILLAIAPALAVRTNTLSALTPHGTRPDLAGKRVKQVNNPKVYLVDTNGKRRWIPNPDTYNNLFRDWNGIVQVIDISSIDEAAAISDGAILVKDPNLAPVYLISNGVKRWITSPAAMDKFYFSWDKIKSAPNIVLSYVQSGPNIS